MVRGIIILAKEVNLKHTLKTVAALQNHPEKGLIDQLLVVADSC